MEVTGQVCTHPQSACRTMVPYIFTRIDEPVHAHLNAACIKDLSVVPVVVVAVLMGVVDGKQG